MTTTQRYHKALIILHWLLAILIIFALVAGSTLEGLPNSDPDKVNALRFHMIGGLLIGLLMLTRLIVRWRTQQPPHAQTGNALLAKLGTLAHWALYILVFAMVLSGMGISIGADLPTIVFAGQGQLPATFNDLPPRAGHGLVAKLLMGLIALHVIAAIYHQVFLKDGLMKRMSLRKS